VTQGRSGFPGPQLGIFCPSAVSTAPTAKGQWPAWGLIRKALVAVLKNNREKTF
jgi:hypothetical protein